MSQVGLAKSPKHGSGATDHGILRRFTTRGAMVSSVVLGTGGHWGR